MDSFDKFIFEKAREEKVEIPSSLEKRINDVFRNIPRKGRTRKSQIGAAIIIALLIVPMLTVYGENIPIVNNIISFFKGYENLKYINDSEIFEKYSEGVNKTISNKNINITIDNIACDDNFLVLFYTLDGEVQKTNRDGTARYVLGNIKLNGKRQSIISNDGLDAYITEDGKLRGMIKANISGESLPKKFNLEYNIDEALDVWGKWHFKFSISKEEAMKDTKIVNVNQDAYVRYPDREHNIKIEKVILSPFSNQIVISEKFYNGNTNPFNLFALYDENGNVLDVLREGATTGGGGARNSFEFLKANKNIKSITFVPIFTYADNAPKEIDYNPIVDIDVFPVELKMSSKGSLVIDKIQYEDTQTKIYYRKKGIVLTPLSVCNFIDEEGKNAFEEISMSDVIVIDREKGIYEAVYPKLDKNKKYKLSYYTDEKFDLLEHYKVEIPMN